jgi:hypothetical protein
MRRFVHTAPHSNIKSVEFLKFLSRTDGVVVENYGYVSFGRRQPHFAINFHANTEAELFIRLKYNEDMYRILE